MVCPVTYKLPCNMESPETNNCEPTVVKPFNTDVCDTFNVVAKLVGPDTTKLPCNLELPETLKPERIVVVPLSSELPETVKTPLISTLLRNTAVPKTSIDESKVDPPFTTNGPFNNELLLTYNCEPKETSPCNWVKPVTAKLSFRSNVAM